MAKIKVLIADDSALTRRVLRKIIDNDKRLEVIGIARDGEDAVYKARELRPDVITMDVNMPKLDGVSSLAYIIEEKICPVVMVSSITSKSSLVTLEALELGAFDYVLKPGGSVSASMDSIAKELIYKIKASVRTRVKKNLFRKRKQPLPASGNKQSPSAKKKKSSRKRIGRFKAVVIGISTGGPKNIMDVLPYIPADINAVFFLVQHMPANFTHSFAERLNKNCQLTVKECVGADKIQPGFCYVGKGGYHMTLLKRNSDEIVIRTPLKPHHEFIPSVGVCMESVSQVFGRDTVGVIMTGMGNDGAESMNTIKKNGGYTIAESEESCVVFGMPARAIEKGCIDTVLPSWEIADKIIKIVGYI